MPLALLATYISLILVRPMDWWEPIKGWQLVNATAIATLAVSFTTILSEVPVLWRRLPPLRVGAWLLVAVSISWIYPAQWLGGILQSFQDFGKIMILFLLIILMGRDPKRLRLLIWTMLLCTVWMAIHAWLQYTTGSGFAELEPIMRTIYDAEGNYVKTVPQTRAFGIFNDPNDLCLQFIVAIPLLYAQARVARNPVFTTIAFSLIPLMGYGAWLTNSRGGIVGLFGMVVAHTIVRTKSLFRRWLVASAAISLITVIAPARFSFAVDVSRVNLWGDGLQMFKEYPIFGVGHNMFASHSGGHVAHNSYITALAELGLFGYIPFVLLIYLTMLYLRRAANLGAVVEREDQLMLTGMFSALSGYLTAIYFLSRNYIAVPYILLAMALCQVVITCQKTGTFEQVFGNWPKTRNRALIWCLASIPAIWGTVLISNRLAGR